MSLKVNNLTYIYNKKTNFASKAINNISFALDDNFFVALVGQTGCGKSTLAQLLNGLLKPTEGEIIIDQYRLTNKRHIKRKDIQNLRKNVGLVLQFPEYQLFEETVEKDVSFGPKNFKVKKEEALEIAHRCINVVGLDESFYKRSPFELSGGEKRKVAIAGILAIRPKILILDEPTAGLDPSSTIEIMNLFKKIHEEENVSIILITHDMEVVNKYAKQVILMDQGEIKSISTCNELFKNDNDLYSLELPRVYKISKKLKENGLNINLENINDIDSLIKEIKGAKNG